MPLKRTHLTRILFLFSIFVSGKGFCQEEEVPRTPINKVISNSPEASALGRYGDIPIDTYTGVPAISIPLHTIDLRDLKIPIFLSYHAGGIKVNDVATNVGLGWSLQAGGIISCSVHGFPDIDHGWISGSVNVLLSHDYKTTWSFFVSHRATHYSSGNFLQFCGSKLWMFSVV